MVKLLTFIAAFLITASVVSRAGAQIVNPPIPKGAVHLLVHNDAEAKKYLLIFHIRAIPTGTIQTRVSRILLTSASIALR